MGKTSEKNKEKSKRWYHKTKNRYWRLILKHYGQKCNCCGETMVEFLQLDHVNNDGALHRIHIHGHPTLNTYRDCVEFGFPKSYQILCINCNFGRNNHGGVCPHQSKREKED